MTISSDTQAILLLCAPLSRNDRLKPLSTQQYAALAQWLNVARLRPADLLAPHGRERLSALDHDELNEARVAPLLDRAAILAISLERWLAAGIWIVSRADIDYPARLKRYLGRAAPPLLYGLGPRTALASGGLAIVGSRDRSEDDGEYARRVGAACAREKLTVLSGAAKGIDRDAMAGALEAGGQAVGVLAEGLIASGVPRQSRELIVDGRLALVSCYVPDAAWAAWRAMDRNAILYGLAGATLVVASAKGAGGTWDGAAAALRNPGARVFVRVPSESPGNSALLDLGAQPFPAEPWDNLTAILHTTAELAPPAVAKPQPAATATDAYSLVLPELLKLLDLPREEAFIAERLDVRAQQARDWLNRAVSEQRVRKSGRPVRYQTAAPPDEPVPPLFAALAGEP